MTDPLFLTLDDVLAIHHDQLERYGGGSGIRDMNLLKSAIAMPAVSFDGAYLHESLPEMSAAYLFHVAQNRPFVDGNKRTALAAALMFVWMNGLRIDVDQHDELYDLVIGVARGIKTKAEIAVFLAAHLTE